MKKQLVLRGRITAGIQWASNRWDAEMIPAHGLALAGFVKGTLNVTLPTGQTWTPQNDERYWQQANADGVARNIPILQTGNYIHPDISVVSINGVEVHGLLYFPAGHKEKPVTRDRLEILSRINIRERLGVGKDQELDVTVVLEIVDPVPGR